MNRYGFNVQRVIDNFPGWKIDGTADGYIAHLRAGSRCVRARTLDDLAQEMTDSDTAAGQVVDGTASRA